MPDAHVVESIRREYLRIFPDLGERTRRKWAAREASRLGRGGIAAVAAATGMSDRTIRTGIKELDDPPTTGGENRQRRMGGGRKPRTVELPDILQELEKLICSKGRTVPLCWTIGSTRSLAKELQARGFKVSPSTIRQMLHSLGYSLHSNRKTQSGRRHPDRDAQFQHISNRVKAQKKAGEPAIFVHLNKGNLGNTKNTSQPDRVGLLVNAIRYWWDHLGGDRYSSANRLLIMADSGGSHSSCNRLWRLELQKLVNEIGLTVGFCHYPPGITKWNKIEQRAIYHFAYSWKGLPPTSMEVVIESIGHMKTKPEKEIHVWVEERFRAKEQQVSNAELAECHIVDNKFHGDWNYEIHPQMKRTPIALES